MNPARFRTWTLFAGAGIALLAAGRLEAAPEGKQEGISLGTIQAHISYLASDELKGRGSGEKGNELAARYIAAQFKRAGLKPIGTSKQNDPKAAMDGSGYFQPFTFPAGVTRGKNNSLQAEVGGKKMRYRVGSDFEPSAVSSSGNANGGVVFVGYGIQAPQRDDYAGQDVKGKIVLLLAGAPGGGANAPLQSFAGIRRKAQIARDMGAAGILVALTAPGEVPKIGAEGRAAGAGLPILTVRRSVAEEWLKSAGRSLPEVMTALESGAQSFTLPVQANMQADLQKVTKTTANIVGLLEGSDPTLKNEIVVIGAHMDHLGMGGPSSLATDKSPAIHYGADDNASGTAGVLMLTDYFQSRIQKPKRSILFICFSAEELGLIGSMHYVNNPILPLDRTVAMLNMDMIGRMRNNQLTVIGTGTSPAWNLLLEEANKTGNFQISRNESGFGGSDHQSFYMKNIPVLFFFTGIHEDYHRPSDTADKINAQDMVRILGLVAGCAERIADMPERPAFQQVTQAAPTSGRGRAGVSLGTIPEYTTEVEGVLLGGVRPGSPAEKAGLKAGDIMIKFGGRSIRSLEEFTAALSEHKPGDVVEVVVRRGQETITVKATLTARGG